MEKIRLAEQLVARPSNIDSLSITEQNTYRENVARAIQHYREVAVDSALKPTPNDIKLDALVSMMRNIPDEGSDLLNRWRDQLPFLNGPELDRLVGLLIMVVKSSDINSHERLYTAVTLYNRGYLQYCYDCFGAIAADKSVLVSHKIESCRYLFGSESDDNKELAQECLLDIIETDLYPSDYRYKIIAGYISRTGLATILNAKKIRVAYDEEFVYGLQVPFFFNEKNDPRDRILSGQHLLDMSPATCSLEQKEEIGNILLAMARNDAYDHNTRADAADVVVRLGTDKQVLTARDIITELGYSAVDTSGKTATSLVDRARTVYNNSQNVHDEKLNECVEKFIEKMRKEAHKFRPRPYHEIHQEVSDLIRVSLQNDPAKKIAAFKALNRISIDTATFTKYKVGIAEIFTQVWLRIQTYPVGSDTRAMLDQRIVEEMVEMGETCSTGHSHRFVNVLSGVDVELRISWESQIIANMAGRMQARIREIQDENLRNSVGMGMLRDADPEDVAAYKKFIGENLAILHNELRQEFVLDKPHYVTDEEFSISFEKGAKQWESK